MDLDRRAFVGTLLAGGLGATRLGPLPGYLEAFSPLSGDAWSPALDAVPDEVASPYGDATVRYDDAGVPTIQADAADALYFATGYVHAADRLFQMDLFRRRMAGTLSAAFGERTVADDVFHTRMGFDAAADANVAALEGTDAGDALSAYADGVNAYRADNPLPLEFHLLDYEPDPWTPAASMLVEKQLTWGLTGSFRTLRWAAVADAWGPDVAARLYPSRLDHEAPILRQPGPPNDAVDGDERPRPFGAPDPALTRSLSEFERDRGAGSNSWVVSGEHTDSGRPLLANDPHLTLLAPPVWYEMHQRTPGMATSGVTFPGTPFVVIGENDHGAWGFTNAGADVIDFYRYEVEGEEYRYGDDWREFDTASRTVDVADGEDREVTVRRTVHGPLVEREGERVGVAWTGFVGSRTAEAVRRLNHSEGLADARAAFERFDAPTQNAVYASRAGDTYYCVTGLIPLRHTDGDVVRGDRIFDGSAMEGTWPGYEPYAPPDLDAGGFVPFADKPQVTNPDYLATANQRVVDDAAIDYYLAESYSPPFRGARIYDLLDRRAATEDPFDREFSRRVQRDVYDRRADLIVPAILAAREEMDGGARDRADALEGWNRRMERDSTGALVFERFLAHYRVAVFDDALDAAGFDAAYRPNDWVLLTMGPEDPWFRDPPVGEARTREQVIVAAMAATAAELEEEGWETYGDYNRTAIDHPFDQSFLNYERLPTDGSPATVSNFRKASAVGSSYRLLAGLADEPSLTIVPGGNSGDYFSEHYADQLQRWADGEYTELRAATDGEPDIGFFGGSGDA
jgi:penicillin amidase